MAKVNKIDFKINIIVHEWTKSSNMDRVMKKMEEFVIPQRDPRFQNFSRENLLLRYCLNKNPPIKIVKSLPGILVKLPALSFILRQLR